MCLVVQGGHHPSLIYLDHFLKYKHIAPIHSPNICCMRTWAHSRHCPHHTPNYPRFTCDILIHSNFFLILDVGDSWEKWSWVKVQSGGPSPSACPLSLKLFFPPSQSLGRLIFLSAQSRPATVSSNQSLSWSNLRVPQLFPSVCHRFTAPQIYCNLPLAINLESPAIPNQTLQSEVSFQSPFLIITGLTRLFEHWNHPIIRSLPFMLCLLQEC